MILLFDNYFRLFYEQIINYYNYYKARSCSCSSYRRIFSFIFCSWIYSLPCHNYIFYHKYSHYLTFPSLSQYKISRSDIIKIMYVIYLNIHVKMGRVILNLKPTCLMN